MEAGDLHSALRRDSTKSLLWYRRRGANITLDRYTKSHHHHAYT